MHCSWSGRFPETGDGAVALRQPLGLAGRRRPLRQRNPFHSRLYSLFPTLDV